jgi:hypothetical protein
MSRALARRSALLICAAVIVSFAARATILQRGSQAQYAHASTALRGDLTRYEALLLEPG